MKTLKNNLYFVLLIIIFSIILFSCKRQIVEIKDIKYVSDEYLSIKYNDKTKTNHDFIIPEVEVNIIKKTNFEIHSLNYTLLYHYGDKHTLKKNVEITKDSKEIELLNEGKEINENFKFENLKKMELPTNYDESNPEHYEKYGITIVIIVDKLKVVK